MHSSLRLVLSFFRRLRRRLLVHRRGLAALSAALAVGIGLHASTRPPERGVDVWTARADLPSGTVLRAGDLRRTAYAPGTRPARAVTDLDDTLGRTLVLSLGRGSPLTTTHLLGRDLLETLPGRSAVALRLPDAAVATLLHAGDRIDLIASDPRARSGETSGETSGEVRRVARDAVVLAVPPESESLRTEGRLVLLAVHDAETEALAVAVNAGFVTVVWSSPR